MEHTPHKCFRCGSEDHMIEKCTNQVRFNEKVNYTCDKGENYSDFRIYEYMAQMSSNDKWKNSW